MLFLAVYITMYIYMYRPLACDVMYCGLTTGAIFYRSTIAGLHAVLCHQCRHLGVPRRGTNHSTNQGGGVTPIGAVSRAMTAVKMQWKGHGTSWGLVKRCSGPHLQHCWWPRGVTEILHMPVINQWSMGQGRKLIVVKQSRLFFSGLGMRLLWERTPCKWP